MGFDSNDVRLALNGRSGVMYQMAKDDTMSIPEFMKSFFDELKLREQVMQSTQCLIHIMASNDDEFTMEQLNFVHDFTESLGENKEIKFGLSESNSIERKQMTITVLCTNEDNSKAG